MKTPMLLFGNDTNSSYRAICYLRVYTSLCFTTISSDLKQKYIFSDTKVSALIQIV
jgi:hypothetical protein